MLSTNSYEIWNSVFSLKDHGKNFDILFNGNKSPGFKWLHETIGTNMRLTEIQAALGRNQLKKLSAWRNLRKRNAMILYQALKDLKLIRIPLPESNLDNAWYRFYCYLNFDYLALDWSRDRIMIQIQELGVKVFTGSCGEIYLEKCFLNWVLLLL